MLFTFDFEPITDVEKKVPKLVQRVSIYPSLDSLSVEILLNHSASSTAKQLTLV